MLPRNRFDELLAASGKGFVEVPDAFAKATFQRSGDAVVIALGPDVPEELDPASALGKLNNFLCGTTDMGTASFDAGAVCEMRLSDGATITSTILETDGTLISQANVLVEVVEGRRSRVIEFDIAQRGAMIEKGDFPLDDIPLEWLGRLAASDTRLTGKRRQPREIFIETYGEAAMKRVEAAIAKQNDDAIDMIIRHMQSMR